jgi:uncharacterized membrane protein HdeD (DUF308 family)
MSATSPARPGYRPVSWAWGSVSSRLALRGMLAILWGVIAILWPTVTVFVLGVLFGVYVLIDSVTRVAAAVRNWEQPGHWAGLLRGVLGVTAGAFALIWPDITIVALAVLVGVWAIVAGVVDFAAALRLPRHTPGRVVSMVVAVVTVVAGTLIWLHPVAGAFGLAIVIGVYAIFFGVLLLFLSRLVANTVSVTVLP